MSGESGINRIVVGVDGSGESIEALRFAVDEARAHGASLAAVSAWSFPPAMPGEWAGGTFDDVGESLEKDAKRTLVDAAEQVGSAAGEIEMESVVRQGPPAEALIAEAQAADLLVVGSRGRGGFKGLLLGSVSQQCADHAPCPITIVKG